MSVLTALEHAEHRRGAVRRIVGPIDFDKPLANSVNQALEDWYEAEKPVVSALIDTATSPIVLSNTVKKAFAVSFLEQKFRREDA